MADSVREDSSYEGWIGKDSTGLVIDATIDWENLDAFINFLLTEKPYGG